MIRPPAPLALALLAAACSVSHAESRRGPGALTAAREALAHADTALAARQLENACRRDHDPAACALLGRLYREHGTIEGRLRSQQVLESARARFPDDLELLMELGRTYFAQHFFPDAVRCFNQVLEADPHHCQAHYLLGLYHFRNWKRMNEFTDDLYAARRELRAAVSCDSSDSDAMYRYLIACYALDDTSSADATRAIVRFPASPEFRLYRGALAWEALDFRSCQRDFADAVALMDGDTRRAYGYVERALPVTDRDRLDDFPPEARDSVLRAYWLRADPDPTTALNERELEFIYRMFVADVRYSNGPTQKRGWETDRGAAFLKFGTPTTVAYTLGDDNRSGKVEMWSYVIGGVFHQFLFVDEFLNGNPRIPYSADILLHYLEHAPPRTALASAIVPIPAALDVVAFRDDNFAASIYLAMCVDADSLRASRADSRDDRLVVRAATFDPAWRRTGAFADTLRLTATSTHHRAGTTHLEVVRRLPGSFDRYHLAMAMEDAHARARASVRGDADAERFVADHTKLSDILLTADPGSGGAGIKRHGQTLVPRIHRGYRAGELLRAYVEIYDLARSARSSRYEIRFAIFPAPDDDASVWEDWSRRIGGLLGLGETPPVIAQSFQRTGTGHDEYETIAIVIDSLPAGAYQLVISVFDGISGQEAQAGTRFYRDAEHLAESEP
ncbi:MAG TPA: tetratricopeptide repeat protein [Candidatus Krumholzibacteria bacterium]|nr:tetratricopeptide repeat protein [Candidatus Krumholzibacteria bacterium]